MPYWGSLSAAGGQLVQLAVTVPTVGSPVLAHRSPSLQSSVASLALISVHFSVPVAHSHDPPRLPKLSALDWFGNQLPILNSLCGYNCFPDWTLLEFLDS